jgi:hypothetical protein
MLPLVIGVIAGVAIKAAYDKFKPEVELVAEEILQVSKNKKLEAAVKAFEEKGFNFTKMAYNQFDYDNFETEEFGRIIATCGVVQSTMTVGSAERALEIARWFTGASIKELNNEVYSVSIIH